MITLKDLNEYTLLRKEIADLKKRINQHESIVSDVVTGSSLEYPYTKHSISITGFSCCYSKRMYNKYSRQIELRQQKAEEIEDYISSIDDSLVRQIVRLRFIDGLSWTAVAHRIGGGNTENSVKVVFHRYLKSCNDCNV